MSTTTTNPSRGSNPHIGAADGSDILCLCTGVLHSCCLAGSTSRLPSGQTGCSIVADATGSLLRSFTVVSVAGTCVCAQDCRAPGVVGHLPAGSRRQRSVPCSALPAGHCTSTEQSVQHARNTTSKRSPRPRQPPLHMHTQHRAPSRVLLPLRAGSSYPGLCLTSACHLWPVLLIQVLAQVWASMRQHHRCDADRLCLPICASPCRHRLQGEGPQVLRRQPVL